MKHLYCPTVTSLALLLLCIVLQSGNLRAQESTVARDTAAFQQYLSAEKIGRCVDVSLLFKIYQGLKTIPNPKLQRSGTISENHSTDRIHPEVPVYEWGYMSSPFAWQLDSEHFPNAVRHELLRQVRSYRHSHPNTSQLKEQLIAALTAFDSVADNRPLFFYTIDSKYKGSIKKYVSRLLKKSMFFNPWRMTLFTRHPSGKKLQRDLGVQFVIGLALYESWIRDVREGRVTDETASKMETQP